MRGWCFGTWGEVSLEVLSLVHGIATPRLEVVDLQPRRLLHAQLASLGGYIHVTSR